MADLFDTSTRELAPIDDQDQLHQAILAGTHSYKAGDLVTVKSPEGEVGTVPAEHVGQAIQAGYGVETPTQRLVREYVDQHKGIKGAAQVAAGQFADEALLGLPEMIFDKTGDPLQVAKKEALKKEHDLANIVGGVGGFAASLFTGAPLFKAASSAGEAATKVVAEKLLAQGGEEVGKRTAKRIAGEIVGKALAKGAGGAVEGGIIAAPHAITETALGDPGDAAETVLSGIGIGMLLGGGGSMAKDFLGLGKDAVVRGAGLVADQEQNAKTVARKMAKVLTGVPEEDILHYAENADRVNAVGSAEQIKDTIDGAVGKYAGDVAVKEALRNDAKAALEEGYKAAKFDKSRAVAPAGLADELQGALENEKATLGSLSTQADDALERSGVEFDKDHLLTMIKDVAGSIGVEGKEGARVVISKEAKGAVDKLMGHYSAIKDGFGDTIAAPQMRGILRDVRRDINFNQVSGEFNDTFNKAAKEYTRGISETLKGRSAGAEAAGLSQIPELQEYAAYMDRMQQLSSKLEAMSEKFGTRERATGALNSILTPKGKLNEELLTQFGQLTGKDYVGQLNAFKDSKATLDRIAAGQDLRSELVPNLHAAYVDAEKAHAAASEVHDQVARLTQDRTQSLIRNQGFKNASIEDRRALERLGGLDGQNYLDMVKDRNVLDSFGKARPQGSRMVNLMGMMLGVPFGAPGIAAGGAVGATLDMYGGQILKKAMDLKPSVAGLLFVEQAMKRTAEKLDGIPAAIERMSSGKGRLPPLRAAGTEAIIRLLDKNPDVKKSDEVPAARFKQLDRLGEKTSELVSNPDLATSQIAALAGMIGGKGAPNVAKMLGVKMSTGLNYLHNELPKSPRPQSPFAPKVKYRPSDHELHVFEQKAAVVHDPLSVIAHLEGGTLTKTHTDALKAVYPGIYRMMQQKVLESATGGAKPLKYTDRTNLSHLFGMALDPSQTPDSVLHYQQQFSAIPDSGAPTQPAPQQSFKPSVNIAGSYASEASRIAERA